MIITILNLMPIGMLDGGHIIRALFSNQKSYRIFSFNLSFHQVLSLFGAIIMAIMGYRLMTLLIFFLIRRHPGPVNDLIPLSSGRKVLGLGLLFMLIVCATPLWGI